MVMIGNENPTSIKGHSSFANFQKITGNIPNLDVVNINAYTKLGKTVFIVLKILSRNEDLISIKGHSSVTHLQKMTGNDLNLDLVYINAHIKFGQILSIPSQDIERK